MRRMFALLALVALGCSTQERTEPPLFSFSYSRTTTETGDEKVTFEAEPATPRPRDTVYQYSKTVQDGKTKIRASGVCDGETLAARVKEWGVMPGGTDRSGFLSWLISTMWPF